MISQEVLALIPARGGSKGINKKNIAILNGKPLIYWTINAAKNSRCVKDVFVSTDDNEIAQIAQQYGAKVIQRPSEFATDEASTIPVISHAISCVNENSNSYRYLALLQPTSPLRTAVHIDECFTLLKEKSANAAISVAKELKSPLKSFFVNDGFLSGIVNNEFPFMRRQDLPETFIANGAIYIVSIDIFNKTTSLLPKRTIPYIMGLNSSIDIDSEEDLRKSEVQMKNIHFTE